MRGYRIGHRDVENSIVHGVRHELDELMRELVLLHSFVSLLITLLRLLVNVQS